MREAVRADTQTLFGLMRGRVNVAVPAKVRELLE